MIYLIILVFLLFATLKYDILGDKSGKTFSFYLILITLILLSGLRYRIGVDTVAYSDAFRDITSIAKIDNYWSYFFEGELDPLWLLLNSICKSIINDFTMVQMIHSIFINSILLHFFKKHTNFYFTAITLYYLLFYQLFNFEVMRESMAVAFFLIAIDSLWSNKIFKYYIKLIPAILSQTFAFVTILIPLINKIKLNRFYFIIITSLALFGFLLPDFLNQYIYLLFFTDRIEYKLDIYLNDSILGTSSTSLLGIFVIIVSKIIPILVTTYMIKNYTNHKKIIPFLLLGTIVLILRIYISIFFRFYSYFSPFIIIGFSLALGLVYQKKINSIKRLIVVFLIGITVMGEFAYYFRPALPTYNSKIKVYTRYYPYSSVFTKKTNDQREVIFDYKIK